MELAGRELMEKKKVLAWNRASRRGTNGRGEGTNVNGDGRRKTNGRRGRGGEVT
jgi:hypothetical protein